jgi:hypothetical protein
MEPLKNRRLLDQIGDRDPITHDGGFVFAVLEEGRITGYEIEWIDAPAECPAHLWGTDEEPKDLVWLVYRVTVEADGLAQCRWADLDRLSETLDVTPLLLRQQAVSSVLVHRVMFLEVVASHYGWHELDHDPLTLSRQEVETRYQEWL